MSIFLAGLFAAAAPQETQSPVVWKWEPDQTRCLLRQDVGNGKYLYVGARPGAKGLGVSIVDTKVRTRSYQSLSSVEVSFLPAGAIKVDGWMQPHQDPLGQVTGVALGSEGKHQFATSSGVTMSHDKFGTQAVTIRSAAAALEAIQVCEDRKMREWGIDPSALRALSALPEPATPPEKWFSWYDYPDRQKIYKNDIDVVARIDVAADGSVAECTVVNRPPAEFIRAACKALKKNASFRPARDAQGRPTAGPYVFVVRFGAYHL